jgi:hypothetical protein
MRILDLVTTILKRVHLLSIALSPEYPEACARGIPNDGCVCEDQGYVTATTALWQFDGKRADENGWIAESVNWVDNDRAVTLLLEQTKGEKFQFNEGVAILPRSELDLLKNEAWARGRFDYHREPVKGNDYHGNLLLHQSVPRTWKQAVQMRLAMKCEIRRRDVVLSRTKA